MASGQEQESARWFRRVSPPRRTGRASKSAAKEPMNRKDYDKALRKLQVELCALQEWVKHKGLRVVVVFEGRDAAGKGGVIKAITERVSPRVFRVVALPAPSDREKSQLYLQRYVPHLPGGRRNRDLRSQLVQPGGRRSRDGVLHRSAAPPLPVLCPEFEHVIVDDGILSDQILARSERRRAGAPVRGPDQGPAAPVEAEPDGSPLAGQVVRIFARARHSCSRRPTPTSRPGPSCPPTTSSGRGSTASATCSRPFPTRMRRAPRSSCPSARQRRLRRRRSLEGLRFVEE